MADWSSKSEIVRRWLEVDCAPLDPLAPEEGIPPASVAAWQELWAKHVTNNSADHLSTWDLSLLCHWGWKIATELGDNEAALERLKPWFLHPDRDDDHPVNVAELFGCRAVSALMLHRYLDAIDDFQVILDLTDQRAARSAALLVRNLLVRAAHSLGETAVPPEIRRLASNVIQRIKPALAASADAAGTYSALSDLLLETFPADD